VALDAPETRRAGLIRLSPQLHLVPLMLRAVSLLFAVFAVLHLHGGLAGPIELSRFEGEIIRCLPELGWTLT